MGSASELECHLFLACDLDLLTADIHAPLDAEVIEVRRMPAAFIQKLRSDRSEKADR